jgi:hypothetical protein
VDARIAALDLPDAVIEFDLLDGDDALSKAMLRASSMVGCGIRGGWQQDCGQDGGNN